MSFVRGQLLYWEGVPGGSADCLLIFGVTRYLPTESYPHAVTAEARGAPADTIDSGAAIARHTHPRTESSYVMEGRIELPV